MLLPYLLCGHTVTVCLMYCLVEREKRVLILHDKERERERERERTREKIYTKNSSSREIYNLIHHKRYRSTVQVKAYTTTDNDNDNE